MGNYGVKISKNGEDVFTATADDIVLTSKNKCFKVGELQSGTISTDSEGFGNTTVTHNLGFVPIVVAIVNYNAGSYAGYYIAPFAITGEANCYLKVTSTDFILQMQGAADTTFIFYYRISETETAT